MPEARGQQRRPRGRPFRFPEDPTPLRAVRGGADARTGWLLAATRLYSAPEEARSRKGFVHALRDLGVTCDQARLSRWESGNLRAPVAVIEAWETVSGVPAGSLVSAVAGLREVLPLTADGPSDFTARLDVLLTRLAGGTARGAEWLEAAQLLAGQPWAYLAPSHWEELARALSREMLVAIDFEFVTRFEAMRALLAVPAAHRSALRAIGALVTDPGAQWARMPTVLLKDLDHPTAQDVTVKILATGRPAARSGAAWAAATKLTRGHFDADGIRRLDALLAVRLLTGEDDENDLLDVAARLPDPAATRVEAVLAGTETAVRLHHLRRSGEMVHRDRIRDVVPGLAHRAQSALKTGAALETDEMLQRLLREALFHGHQHRRHESMLLLAASPYRGRLADELILLLQQESDTDLAPYLAGTLRRVARPGHGADLLALSAGSAAPEVRAHTLRALGDLGPAPVPGVQDARSAPEVLDLARADGHATVRRAATYALGMAEALPADLRGTHDDGERAPTPAVAEPDMSWGGAAAATTAC